MDAGVTSCHVLQNGCTDASGDAAVANPGSAYGASALGPSAGGASTAAPANPDAYTGTQPEPMPSQPLQDGDEEHLQDGEEEREDGEEDGQVKKEQSGASKRALKGLGLPFDPVALTFRDIHYFVKNPNQKSQELELLKVRQLVQHSRHTEPYLSLVS